MEAAATTLLQCQLEQINGQRQLYRQFHIILFQQGLRAGLAVAPTEVFAQCIRLVSIQRSPLSHRAALHHTSHESSTLTSPSHDGQPPLHAADARNFRAAQRWVLRCQYLADVHDQRLQDKLISQQHRERIAALRFFVARWKRYVKSRQLMRKVLENIFLGVSERSLRSTFSIWRAFISKHRNAESKMKTLLTRWRSHRQIIALSAWKHFTYRCHLDQLSQSIAVWKCHTFFPILIQAMKLRRRLMKRVFLAMKSRMMATKRYLSTRAKPQQGPYLSHHPALEHDSSTQTSPVPTRERSTQSLEVLTEGPKSEPPVKRMFRPPPASPWRGTSFEAALVSAAYRVLKVKLLRWWMVVNSSHLVFESRKHTHLRNSGRGAGLSRDTLSFLNSWLQWQRLQSADEARKQARMVSKSSDTSDLPAPIDSKHREGEHKSGGAVKKEKHRTREKKDKKEKKEKKEKKDKKEKKEKKNKKQKTTVKDETHEEKENVVTTGEETAVLSGPSLATVLKGNDRKITSEHKSQRIPSSETPRPSFIPVPVTDPKHRYGPTTPFLRKSTEIPSNTGQIKEATPTAPKFLRSGKTRKPPKSPRPEAATKRLFQRLASTQSMLKGEAQKKWYEERPTPKPK